MQIERVIAYDPIQITAYQSETSNAVCILDLDGILTRPVLTSRHLLSVAFLINARAAMQITLMEIMLGVPTT